MNSYETNQAIGNEFPKGDSVNEPREHEDSKELAETGNDRDGIDAQSVEGGENSGIDSCRASECESQEKEADFCGENFSEDFGENLESVENETVIIDSDFVEQIDDAFANVGGETVGVAERQADEVVYTKAEVERLCREAFNRGVNAKISLRIKKDSRTKLRNPNSGQSFYPLLSGRKSVWDFD